MSRSEKLGRGRASQPLPDEVLAGLQEFLRARFYPGAAVTFAKDLPRLRQWVIFYPAKWLNRRGVTLTPARYREVIQTVLLDALAHATGQIKYLPAWLKNVLEKHFAHHGEEYYAEAKNLRAQTEQTMSVLGRLDRQPDIAADFAKTARLLKAAKPKNPPQNPPLKPN